MDAEIGRWLRSETTPVILVGNKAEGRAGDSGLLEAYELGLGDPVRSAPSMARGGRSVRAAPALCRGRAAQDEADEAGQPLKLAIVGRPNAASRP
jgi:GTP-binding protein